MKIQKNVFDNLLSIDLMKIKYDRSENDCIKIFKANFWRLYRRKLLKRIRKERIKKLEHDARYGYAYQKKKKMKQII